MLRDLARFRDTTDAFGSHTLPVAPRSVNVDIQRRVPQVRARFWR